MVEYKIPGVKLIVCVLVAVIGASALTACGKKEERFLPASSRTEGADTSGGGGGHGD